MPISNATRRELTITDQVASHGTYDVVAYINNANYTVSQSAYVTFYSKSTVLHIR